MTTPPTSPLAAPLQDRHRIALREAIEWLPCVARPAGIVASGSIVRGNPGPSSDLDLVILHDAPWRRRVQRWFNGTPVELFFNPEAWLRHCIRSEAAEGRPVMAHMLATGELLLDTDGRLGALKDLSLDLLQRGPCLTPEALLRDRYAAATQVEDALDFGEDGGPDAAQARALAVNALVRHQYLRHNRFLPRPKERLQVLSRTEPSLVGQLAQALTQPPAQAAEALRTASLHVIEATGFFEWDSGTDGSQPPTAR
jgi:hypothetical protein